jgi:tRNA A-37 threonylcarbamoyl transferase component Bud32
MPEKIGHYTIVSQLGRGGMGIVYKAREESLNRFVAIKVLTEQLTDDDVFLQRFVREAQAAAGLSHPNIVQIFYIGEDEQKHPYFVMEHVTGRSLNRVLRDEGQIGNPRAAQLILQAAHGLAAAHDKGIIHRDIKPANLMLDERGLVKIADFGLALPADSVTKLTATGLLVGTPGYLAPEQCLGEKIDQRTDIYALGITFYELLTGVPPFRGESPLALLRQIMDEEPPDVGSLNPSVDDETRAILKKMIAKDREQRYPDCHQIVSDLEDYLARHGVRSMTAGLATLTRGAVVGAAAIPAIAPEAMSAPTQNLASGPQDTPTIVVPHQREPQTQPDAPMLAGDTVPPRGATVPVAMAAIPIAAPAPSPAVAAPAYVPPAAPPPAATPPAATPAKKSSSTMLIVTLALLMVLGGGAAVAFYAMKMYHSWRSGSEPETAIASTTTSTTQTTSAADVPATATTSSASALAGSTPQSGVLLSQGMNPPAVSPGTPAATTTQPVAAPEPAQLTHPTTTHNSTVPPATNVAPGRTVTPAPTAAPSRRLSGVAVAVTGDQGLLGSISGVLTSELDAAGLKVVDAQTLPATENLVRGGEVSASRLIDRLRGEGLAVLLLARVDPAGERELNYMGRHDTAYRANVTLTTYDLATGKPFGTPTRGAIEYTSATADRESEKVVGRLARNVAESIQNH